jgi:UPF0716 protein FxsA
VLGRLFLLLILVLLAELAVLLWIAQHTSWLVPLSLVIGAGIWGAWLAGGHSSRTLRRMAADLDAGRMPTDSLLDGLIVFAAAVLLILPGVLSDLVALVLLFPPSRALVKRLLVRRFQRRLRASFQSHGPGEARYAQYETHAHGEIAHDEIIDARVVDSPAAADPRRP